VTLSFWCFETTLNPRSILHSSKKKEVVGGRSRCPVATLGDNICKVVSDSQFDQGRLHLLVWRFGYQGKNEVVHEIGPGHSSLSTDPLWPGGRLGVGLGGICQQGDASEGRITPVVYESLACLF